MRFTGKNLDGLPSDYEVLGIVSAKRDRREWIVEMEESGVEFTIWVSLTEMRRILDSNELDIRERVGIIFRGMHPRPRQPVNPLILWLRNGQPSESRAR